MRAKPAANIGEPDVSEHKHKQRDIQKCDLSKLMCYSIVYTRASKKSASEQIATISYSTI